MAAKLKAIFDSKVTWIAIGTVFGTVFGDTGRVVIEALGTAVMAVL